MPRRARLVLPGIPLHIIQRGNNRSRCFYTDTDYLVYLDMLRECTDEAGCAVHAFVLMTNHVHLLISPGDPDAPGKMMQRLGQRYVQYVNRRQQRSGTLWEGRFRSCLVGDDRYLLVCQRYIELNPVRAGLASAPGLYPWSSYRANALGHQSSIVTPHPVYLSLDPVQAEREIAYRALFQEALPEREIAQIRQASNGNYTFGNDEFAAMAERELGRAAVPSSRGRLRSPLGNCAKNVL